METLLLAGEAEIGLTRLAGLLPAEFASEIQEKVGMRLLIVKASDRFIAQIQACDEKADQDTRDDLRHLVRDPPEEFAAALEAERLRFLIVTYDPARRSQLEQAVDEFVREGLLRYDCTDGVRTLTV